MPAAHQQIINPLSELCFYFDLSTIGGVLSYIDRDLSQNPLSEKFDLLECDENHVSKSSYQLSQVPGPDMHFGDDAVVA
jgi:hypothetical protein